MKIAVIGTGSSGKRHLGNLITAGVLPSDILVVDTRSDRIHECRTRFGISESFDSIEPLLDRGIDGACICSPTALHLDQAIKLASKGTHLMIEKPLAHNLDGADQLKHLIDEKGIKVLIAYPFRFSEHGRKLKELIDSSIVGKPLYVRGEFSEYLPDWHPWEDYRTFYMAKTALGGGSLLDQSHIMDMAHYCLGTITQVFGFNGRISDLEVETDDLAEMQVRFESGVIGTIHQDMFGRKHTKLMEIKCTEGNIFWDVYDLSVSVFDRNANRTETYHFAKDHQIMFLNEIRHFLDLCNGVAEKPVCTLEDGIHGMQIIDAVRRSQQSGALEGVV